MLLFIFESLTVIGVGLEACHRHRRVFAQIDIASIFVITCSMINGSGGRINFQARPVRNWPLPTTLRYKDAANYVALVERISRMICFVTIFSQLHRSSFVKWDTFRARFAEPPSLS